MTMTYEKAELILQQLMAGDRDYYLVQRSDGRPAITDSPNDQQRIIETLPKTRPKWCRRAVSILLCFLVPVSAASLVGRGATPSKLACERRACCINRPARRDDQHTPGGIVVEIGR